MNLGTSLFRPSCLQELSGFDESLRYGEDSDFFIKAWHRGFTKIRTEETVLSYQMHQSNMTLRAPDDKRMMLELISRQLRRRRNGGLARLDAGLMSSTRSPSDRMPASSIW